MIRRSHEDGDLLVPQVEHSLQAGRLASLWRDLPGPRDALMRAVALHDAGWPVVDDAPTPLPDGRAPHVFDLAHGSTVPIWRRSVAVARASGPLEALLVSRHFARFSPEFAAEQEVWEGAWRIGVPTELEQAGAELVGTCDAISLRLLCDPDESVGLPPGIHLEPDGRLDPWPFLVDRIEDRVVARLLPRRRWDSPAELREAWAAAPLVPLEVTLRPF